jgi:catechol 2,3-dioxygenase-like lactoylglutathione lyase family enzyme
MYILGLDHVVLCVKDVDETLRFYARVLGMRPREERPGMARKGGHAIGVAPKGKSRSAGIAPTRHRQIGFWGLANSACF